MGKEEKFVDWSGLKKYPLLIKSYEDTSEETFGGYYLSWTALNASLDIDRFSKGIETKYNFDYVRRLADFLENNCLSDEEIENMKITKRDPRAIIKFMDFFKNYYGVHKREKVKDTLKETMIVMNNFYELSSLIYTDYVQGFSRVGSEDFEKTINFCLNLNKHYCRRIPQPHIS